MIRISIAEGDADKRVGDRQRTGDVIGTVNGDGTLDVFEVGTGHGDPCCGWRIRESLRRSATGGPSDQADYTPYSWAPRCAESRPSVVTGGRSGRKARLDGITVRLPGPSAQFVVTL